MSETEVRVFLTGKVQQRFFALKKHYGQKTNSSTVTEIINVIYHSIFGGDGLD